MKTAMRTMLLAGAALLLVGPTTAMAAGKPGAATRGAQDVSPTASTVSASVNPNGLVTTWYFQYGKTNKYGKRTAAQDAGSGKKALRVSSTLTSLTPNTTYHYRIVATNSAGSKVGADKTLHTPEVPTVSTIATAPSPNVFGQPVVVSGFLVGPRGGGGKQVALEGNGFPFSAGFTQIGNTVVTADNGGYQFVFTPVTTLQLRVVDRSNPSIVSPVLTQNVALKVGIHHGKRGRSGRVRFAGKVTPAGNSSVVLIQRRKRGGWTTVAHPLPHNKSGRAYSTYSRKFKARGGVYRAVAKANGGGYVEGISKRTRVKKR
jgi:hypothetical protein